MGLVRRDDGSPGDSQRASSWPPTASALILLLCVTGPELANLAPTDAQAWAWYLAANEAAKSMLCLMIAGCMAPLRIYAAGASIWFATQAADELTNGNLYAEHRWEYVLLAVLVSVLWLINKRTA